MIRKEVNRLKEKLISYLENQTAFFNLDELSDIFTANKMSLVFNVKRNTVSHYLNQLTGEGILVKINSRPVYYFHKVSFEQQFFPIEKNNYNCVEEIKNERPLFETREDLFSLLVGHNKSLSRSIDQIKIALNYPDNGLPVLITGESGTGKSFFVNIIHKYCVENNLIEEGARLVTLNCAQYANNPELLTSHLFGHKKGSFTGAEEDKKGAFNDADGGILFLDEVHRLSAEGQEKLFTYLDQGVIYQMGDHGNPISIKTRLFFATTENMDSIFLKTFIRRIPIQIELPSLKSKSYSERLELIYSFFINEQRRIKKDIQVSGQALTIFANGSFKGNIGELKNNVKVAVAKAYSEQKNELSLNITIHHLAEKIIGETIAINGSNQEAILIDGTTTIERLTSKSSPTQEKIRMFFEKILCDFQKAGESICSCEDTLKKDTEELFDSLLFETNQHDKHEMIIYLTKYIRETFKQMQSAYQISFNGNSIYAISHYLYERGRTRWYPEDDEINDLIRSFENQISNIYATSYRYVNRILDLCKPKLDIEITALDKICLTLYLNRVEWTKEAGLAKAIIVAHGYATASSIANVANRFLGKDIFESFDMPIDVTPKKIAEEILSYSEMNDISNGIVILVDMGSLKEIYEYFPKKMKYPVVIMNNVTTPIAISIGENIQKRMSLQEIIEKTRKDTPLNWKIIYPEDNKIKVILTTCLTGIGTATHISNLLEKSLPYNDFVKILPYEFNLLIRNKTNHPILSTYDILGVIGTDNPELEGIPYLSLEDLIAGNEEGKIYDWLKNYLTTEEKEQFNNNIVRNFSLEKVIDSVTILDTDKVMREIEGFMYNLEAEAQIIIKNSQKIALFVHVSCLLERLIRNVPIVTYDGYHQLQQCQNDYLKHIKSAFSVIENDYSVNIPDSEIAYVYDIVFKKTDDKLKDEDF